MIENPLYLILGGTDLDNAVLEELDYDPPAWLADHGSEEAYVEDIEDLRLEGSKGARVTLRLPVRLTAYLQALASTNGRSLAAEAQAALEVHESLSRLSALLDQDLQQRRKDASGGTHGITGESAERFADVLREDVSAEWRQAFEHSRDLFDRRFGDFLMSARPSA